MALWKYAMNKLRKSITKEPMDIIVICVIAILYLLNNKLLKHNTTGALRMFLVCYFNDFMAPIFLLAYSNILLGTKNMRLGKIKHILPFCLCMGCIWEFFAPIIKNGSVTDPYDIIAYLLGGGMYWVIEKIRTRKDDYSTKYRQELR